MEPSRALYSCGCYVRGTEDARDGDKDCRRRAHGTQARVGDCEGEIGGGGGAVRGGGVGGVGAGRRFGVASGASRPAGPAHGAVGGAARPGGGGTARTGRTARRGRRRRARGAAAGCATRAARRRRWRRRWAVCGCRWRGTRATAAGRACGQRERALDIAGSMTPAARRMASPGGIVVLLRGGGPSADGTGGRELRTQARRAGDARGGRRRGEAPDGGACRGRPRCSAAARGWSRRRNASR